ncbi:MAG: AAA family ATPase [Planctomycetota bacterium]
MKPLVEKYKPRVLAEFAGMNRPKAILGAVAREPYSSAWLLLGDSRTGKTTMGLAFAEAIGAQVVHIPSRECDLERVQQVCHNCHSGLLFAKWTLVLVDEADQMSKPAQLAFLSKLDTTAMPPNTVFVFTANSTEKLEDRFLSRVRTLRFETSDLLEPGAALLSRIWHAETGNGDSMDFRAILTTAGMNLRAAIMELEMLALVAPRTWGCACGETNPQRWEVCGECGRPQ